MNKSLIKFVTDFGPLLIFFIFYYRSGHDLKIAIPPLIVATLASLVINLFIRKKNSTDTFGKWNFNYTIWWFNTILQ